MIDLCCHKCTLALVTVSLLLVAACGRQPGVDHDDRTDRARNNVSGLVTGKAISVGTFSNAANGTMQFAPWLTFRERPIDHVNQMALKDAISRNSTIRKIAEETQDMTDDGVITMSDCEEIAAIVERVEGFEPSAFGGWLFKFGAFTEIVIPGSRNNLNYNLYLVRFPGRAWVLVSAKHP